MSENYLSISDLNSAIGIYVSITIATFIVLSFTSVFLQNFLNKTMIKNEVNKHFKLEKERIKEKLSFLEANVCTAMISALGSYDSESPDAVFLWSLRSVKMLSDARKYEGANESLARTMRFLSYVDNFKDVLRRDISVIGKSFDAIEVLKKEKDIDQKLLKELEEEYETKYKRSIKE